MVFKEASQPRFVRNSRVVSLDGIKAGSEAWCSAMKVLVDEQLSEEHKSLGLGFDGDKFSFGAHRCAVLDHALAYAKKNPLEVNAEAAEVGLTWKRTSCFFSRFPITLVHSDAMTSQHKNG